MAHIHSNYRRVNIDGKSLYKTETRVAAEPLLPGTFAVINADNKFALAKEAAGRLYLIGVEEHAGGTIRTQIKTGHSAIGNYLEDGREFAVLVPAGTYKKDQPIGLGAKGAGAVVEEAKALGYNQDDVTITAKEGDFIRVRIRAGVVTASAAPTPPTPPAP